LKPPTAAEPTAEAPLGFLPLVTDDPVLLAAPEDRPEPEGGPAPDDPPKGIAKPEKDYAMPQMTKGGWYETVNQVSESALGGLYHLANGELWEVREHIVKTLLENGIEPYKMVKHGGLETPLWRVDKGGEDYYTTVSSGTTWTSAATHVNDCVLKAVDKYLEGMGLGALSKGDARWFKYHPNTTTDGVSRTHILGVVQGLVAPYGLGIDRVFFPKLSGLGEEHKDFAKALGINPGGLASNAISNAEFLESIGQPEGDIADTIYNDYRMEFVDEPPKPCVAMVNSAVMKYQSGTKVANGAKKVNVPKKGGTNVGGQWSQTSVGQGHADYLGPRDNVSGTWVLAFTIARGVRYKAPLAAYEEVEEKDDKFAAKEKKKEEEKKSQSLAAFSSKIGGTSLSEISKEKSKRVVAQRHAPASVPQKPAPTNGEDDRPTNDEQVGSIVTVYATDGSKQEYYIEEDGSRVMLPDREPASDDGPIFHGTCVECGGRTKKLDEYEWCTACNWWAADDGEDWKSWMSSADETVCPFCGDELTNGCCGSCPYNAAQWQQSCVLRCPVHDVMPYHKGSKYICPACLSDIGMDLVGYMEMDANMHFGLVPLESGI